MAKTISFQPNSQSFSRLKLFLAFSRTHHGILDLAMPCLGALLWLGRIPDLFTVVIGFITAFAGYTAVYALNDVVDFRSDQEKIRKSGEWSAPKGLDSVYIRHPLAQGLLSLWDGIGWVVGWTLLAFIGAYILNPVCALIFIISCLLEAFYCLLLRITFLRVLVSGVVKTSGGIAAIFAVDPHPSGTFLVVFFFWLFLWEIGGQNVASDWADVEEDLQLRARTVPVKFGLQGARITIIFSLIFTVLLSLVLYWFIPTTLSPVYAIGALVVGIYLLLLPAYRLYKIKASQEAANLFSRASCYPAVMLLVLMVSWIV
jgi:4-hydroxybenzoate polyprenyltransferase and related prenyltransferases